MNNPAEHSSMTVRQGLLQQFEAWIGFVRTLEQDEVKWNTSLGDGRWSVREVVSHIALWDKYFFEEAIEKIQLGEPLTVRHLDYDAFNENAKQHGKLIQTDLLADQAITYRTRILELIASFSEVKFNGEYTDADGQPFTVVRYLKDFIWHDNHHLEQMKPIL